MMILLLTPATGEVSNMGSFQKLKKVHTIVEWKENIWLKNVYTQKRLYS